jgi:hypothetical protein
VRYEATLLDQTSPLGDTEAKIPRVRNAFIGIRLDFRFQNGPAIAWISATPIADVLSGQERVFRTGFSVLCYSGKVQKQPQKMGCLCLVWVRVGSVSLRRALQRRWQGWFTFVGRGGRPFVRQRR